MADVYFEGGAFGDAAEAQRMSVEHFMLTDREDFVKAGKLECVTYLLMNLDKKSIAYLMNRSDSRGIYNAVGNLKSKIKKLPEEKLQKYTPLLKLRMKKGKRNGFKGAKG